MQHNIFYFLKLFFASHFLQSSWSFYSMQSLGFLFNTIIGLDKENQKKLLQQNRVFFNTHPYMAGYIIGSVLRAYERKEETQEINKHIMVSQSAFATTGDMLFWQTIRPALLLLAVIVGLKYGIIGPLLFLVLYNIIHLSFRFYGFIAGYKDGWDVVFVLRDKKIFLLQRIFETMGSFLAGLLPVVLQKSYTSFFLIPLAGIFFILLQKKVAPILILTFVFILIIINLILL